MSDTESGPQGMDSHAGERLRSFVDRIERIEEERDALGEDLKEIYAEVKGEGFDVAVLKEAIKRRKKDQSKLETHESMLELYEAHIGKSGGQGGGEED